MSQGGTSEDFGAVGGLKVLDKREYTKFGVFKGGPRGLGASSVSASTEDNPTDAEAGHSAKAAVQQPAGRPRAPTP